jgi:hypothetical protein
MRITIIAINYFFIKRAFQKQIAGVKSRLIIRIIILLSFLGIFYGDQFNKKAALWC